MVVAASASVGMFPAPTGLQTATGGHPCGPTSRKRLPSAPSVDVSYQSSHHGAECGAQGRAPIPLGDGMTTRFLRATILVAAVAASLLVAAPGANAETPDVIRDFCGPQCMQQNSCESQLRQAGTYVPGYGCNTPLTSLSTYKGWATTATSFCTRNMYSAWAWSGRWTRGYIAEGTRIYVWPYAVDWSWVWTSRTGWRAMRDKHIVINAWQDPFAPRPMCAEPPWPTYVD